MKRVLWRWPAVLAVTVAMAGQGGAQQAPGAVLRWIAYPFPVDVSTALARPPALVRDLALRRARAPEGGFQPRFETRQGSVDVGGIALRRDGRICLDGEACTLYTRGDSLRLRLATTAGRLPVRIELGLER